MVCPDMDLVSLTAYLKKSNKVKTQYGKNAHCVKRTKGEYRSFKSTKRFMKCFKSFDNVLPTSYGQCVKC